MTDVIEAAKKKSQKTAEKTKGVDIGIAGCEAVMEAIHEFRAPMALEEFKKLKVAIGKLDDADDRRAASTAIEIARVENMSLKQIRESLKEFVEPPKKTVTTKKSKEKELPKAGSYSKADEKKMIARITSRDGQPDWLGEDYVMYKGKLWEGRCKEEKEKKPVWSFYPICVAFECLGLLRDEKSEDWGTCLRFKDRDGVTKDITIDHSSLFSDQRSVIGQLAGSGFYLEGHEDDTLIKILMGVDTKKKLKAISRGGWVTGHDSRNVFVSPTGEVFFPKDYPEAEKKFLLKQGVGLTNPGKAGVIDKSNDAIDAIMGSANYHMMITVCVGLAGPSVSLLKLESAGVAIIGNSSSGKSMGQKVAASFWGPCVGGSGGILTSCNTTGISWEGLAQNLSGVGAMLDEGETGSDEFIASISFNLGANEGRQRLAEGGKSTQKVRTWNLPYTISMEKSPSKSVEAAKKADLTGRAVRMIVVNAGECYDELSDGALKAIAAISTNYGHIGPQFIESFIAEGYADNPDRVRKLIDECRDQILNSVDDATKRKGAFKRAATNFAAFLAAGKLAIEFEIFGMDARIDEAFEWAWKAYINSQEGALLNTQNSLFDEFVENVATWNGKHIVPTNDKERRSTDIYAYRDDGLWDRGVQVAPPVLYILQGKFRKFFSKGTTEALRNELNKRGILIESDDMKYPYLHRRIPDVGSVKHLRLDLNKLRGIEGEISDGVGEKHEATKKTDDGDNVLPFKKKRFPSKRAHG